MSHTESHPENDRDWLAFRYVAGELSGEEAAAFEAELETSQVSREAVARAVELTHAVAIAEFHGVALVESATRPSPRKSWTYGIVWMGAGAVAASVAGAVWWNMQSPATGTSELAERWTEARSVEPAPTAIDESVETTPVLDVAQPDVAPSWMTSGVISLSGGKVEDDGDGDGKPDESWDDEILEN